MCKFYNGYYDNDIKGLSNVNKYNDPKHEGKFEENIDIYFLPN